MLATERPARPPSRLSWAWQLAGVVLAGGAGLVVDVVLLWVLAVEAGVPRGAAAAISFTASGVVNFALNRVVFRGQGGGIGRHSRRFLVLFLNNLVVTTLLVPLLAHGLDDLVAPESALLLAKAVTVLALLVVNAVLYRTWVFTGGTTADDGER